MGEEPAILTHGQLQPPGRRTGDRGRPWAALVAASSGGWQLARWKVEELGPVEDGADLPAEHGRLAGNAEERGGGGGGATAGARRGWVRSEDDGWRMGVNSRRSEKPTGTRQWQRCTPFVGHVAI